VIELTPGGSPDGRNVSEPEEVAALLARLWSETLGVEADAQDSFFSLGGDSITAMRMLSRASALLGTRVPYSLFRDSPTIDGLIAAARSAGAVKQDSTPSIARAAAGSERQAPISKQQFAAWYAHLVAPESRAYLAESTTTLVGALDVGALRESLLALFDRHEIYRTVFHEQDREPVQTILSETVLYLEEIDASTIPPEEWEAFVERAIAERLPVIPDLSRLPLCNFLLIRFAPERHVLVHREHHIIHDGWSSSEFTRELIELYKARVLDGYAPDLSDPIPYRDYVRAQADWLETADAEKQLAYWRDRLEGSAEDIRLFGKASNSLSYEGDHVRTRFTRAEWQAFEAAAHSLGVTSFVLFTAVMFVCLWRYSGQKQLSLGSAFASRSWAGSDRVLGMLVNTVVLTQRIDPEQPLSGLVEEVDSAVQGALENQDYPFVSLVEKLHAGRADGSNPFTNVLVGFHDTPIDAAPPPGLDFYKDETVSSDSTKFDLTALVVPRARHSNAQQDVNVLWEYRSQVYDRWEIEGFTSSVAHVVREVASGSASLLSAPLRALDVTTPAQNDLLACWSQGDRRPLPLGEGLAASIAARAADRPSAVAITDGPVQLTYAELVRLAANLAAAIRTRLPAPGASVGIAYPRGAANLVAMLAALQAGIPFVMLDPQFPPARVDYIVSDSEVRLVLGPADAFAPGSDAAALPRLEALGDPGGEAGESAPLEFAAPSPRSLAYIGYTSGSTGRPKGVEVTERALANVAAWQAEAFGYSDRTVATSQSYPGFDAYMSEVWAPLLSGGRLVILSDEVKSDPAALARALNEEGVTSLFLPSGLFREFAASGVRWPASLETVSAGGEALPDLELPSDFRGRFYNLYGPTETTVFSTAACLCRPQSTPPPIGRPIANNDANVIDADGLVCPPGVPGELFVAGEGVALGYRGLDEETAARFDIPSDGTGPRTFRTGDCVRWNADGELLFLGRLDDELKVRGYRVAPGEIVSLLKGEPGVAQAVVAVKSQALFAYVVRSASPDDDDRPSDGAFSRALRRALKKQLPDYMLPQAIILIPKLPLTRQGKLDKDALPWPLDRTADPGRLAQTPTEKGLQSIWQNELRRPEVPVSVNFFAVGGHSLLAMRVIALVRKAFGVELGIADFYRNGTIAAQARRIDEARRAAADVPEPAIEEGTI
jgi:amino acid adenylation domain-containing protein